MKTIETVNSEVNFTPIPVTILIETEEEYDALLKARTSLCSSDIDHEQWDEGTREVWVNALEVIAERAANVFWDREVRND